MARLIGIETHLDVLALSTFTASPICSASIQVVFTAKRSKERGTLGRDQEEWES